MKNRLLQWMGILAVFAVVVTFLVPRRLPAQEKGIVVEEIVARVNNQIITLSDFEQAEHLLQGEVTHDCQGCASDKIQAEFNDQKKDVLRGLIDNALLLEHAKDLGISVETDVIKQLDQVRKDNNLATMEELQKAVESEGIAWEDYKTQMRNKLLTQEVISREVGGRMNFSSDEIKQFYEAHKDEFNTPEEVFLASLFLSTDGKTPEEAAAVHQKADDMHNRIVKGEDFNQLATRYSEDDAASQGGNLGAPFKRGGLSKQIEDVVFAMNKGDVTDVIQVKTGFEIFKVVNHFQAGVQPLEKVQEAITNKLYEQKMEPAMRNYLAELREESYVMVKPGYTDSAAVAGAGVIQEVAPTPDTPGKKKDKKKMTLPKVNS
jgi:peptidyl-prolyl cis-trans isomerase SurA